MAHLQKTIFLVDVVINCILLLGVAWSIRFPERRIWPPPRKRSWRYSASWGLFYIAFFCNLLLVVLDWDTGAIPDAIRFLIGIPAMVIGGLLVTWGLVTLGTKNTSGLRNGLVLEGAYRYTRNPQYLGDMLLFAGISSIANSLYVLVVHLLMIVVFLLVPFAEEVWLEEEYGGEYLAYKKRTARFMNKFW